VCPCPHPIQQNMVGGVNITDVLIEEIMFEQIIAKILTK
jgi:hypothetical protein